MKLYPERGRLRHDIDMRRNLANRLKIPLGCDLVGGMLRTDMLLNDLVRSAHTSGLTKSRIAEDAKVHANTLRRFGDPEWNPSVKTLRRLEEALLPEEGSVPSPQRRPTSRRRV